MGCFHRLVLVITVGGGRLARLDRHVETTSSAGLGPSAVHVGSGCVSVGCVQCSGTTLINCCRLLGIRKHYKIVHALPAAHVRLPLVFYFLH